MSVSAIAVLDMSIRSSRILVFKLLYSSLWINSKLFAVLKTDPIEFEDAVQSDMYGYRYQIVNAVSFRMFS